MNDFKKFIEIEKAICILEFNTNGNSVIDTIKQGLGSAVGNIKRMGGISNGGTDSQEFNNFLKTLSTNHTQRLRMIQKGIVDKLLQRHPQMAQPEAIALASKFVISNFNKTFEGLSDKLIGGMPSFYIDDKGNATHTNNGDKKIGEKLNSLGNTKKTKAFFSGDAETQPSVR